MNEVGLVWLKGETQVVSNQKVTTSIAGHFVTF